jgi:regulator of protease activity HflC (stomatin/prohibitin superfamily)
MNYALWKISEPHSFITNVETIGSAEVLIESAVYSAARQKYSELTYDEIINGNASGKDYNADITAEVSKQLKNTGMNIVDVQLMQIDLTSDDEEAAYAQIKSEREKIAKQYLSTAENEASK